MTRRVAEHLGWSAVAGVLAVALLIAAATASLATASAAPARLNRSLFPNWNGR